MGMERVTSVLQGKALPGMLLFQDSTTPNYRYGEWMWHVFGEQLCVVITSVSQQMSAESQHEWCLCCFAVVRA